MIILLIITVVGGIKEYIFLMHISAICIVLECCIFFPYIQKVNSDSKYIWRKNCFENVPENVESEDDFIIYSTKDLIKRNLLVQEEIKWNDIKILDKDQYGKNLVYVNFASKNAFGTYMNSYALVPIKINQNFKEYFVKSSPKVFYINCEEESKDNSILNKYKKKSCWNKKILLEQEFIEIYKIKNTLSNIVKMIKDFGLYFKIHKKVSAFIIIICIICFGMYVNSLRREVVPNLIGMTITEAQEVIADYDLELKTNFAENSSEIITNQSQPENTKVKLNSIITVSTEEYNKKINRPNNTTIITAAKTLINLELKSSTTARWGKAEVIDSDDYDKYLVYVDLEAQNSFGAYVKSAHLVIVKVSDNSGEFSHSPYMPIYDVSSYQEVNNYKNGVINNYVQMFLKSNSWNEENNTTE